GRGHRGHGPDLAVPDGDPPSSSGSPAARLRFRPGRCLRRGVRDPQDAGRDARCRQLRDDAGPHRDGRRRPRRHSSVDPPARRRQAGLRRRRRRVADGRADQQASRALLLLPGRERGHVGSTGTGGSRGAGRSALAALV
ncbi:MAG: hypothetical protein AVDCRST_MAG69-1084, partial [uncultured Solirubrobacteraceae bacterium]